MPDFLLKIPKNAVFDLFWMFLIKWRNFEQKRKSV